MPIATAVATSTAATLLHFAFYIAKLSGSWASCLHVLCIFTLIEIVAGNWKERCCCCCSYMLLLCCCSCCCCCCCCCCCYCCFMGGYKKCRRRGRGAWPGGSFMAILLLELLLLRLFYCCDNPATSLVCPGLGHSSNLIYPVSWFSWRPYKCPTNPCPAMAAFSRFSPGFSTPLSFPQPYQ